MRVFDLGMDISGRLTAGNLNGMLGTAKRYGVGNSIDCVT